MKCKICNGKTIEFDGICGFCKLSYRLLEFKNAKDVKEDIRNMPIGSLEQSKIEFFDRHI